MLYCDLSDLRLYFGFIMKIQEKDLKEMNGKRKKRIGVCQPEESGRVLMKVFSQGFKPEFKERRICRKTFKTNGERQAGQILG